MANPRPTALPEPLTNSTVDANRRVFCQRYDDCLDEACRRNWRSFSCANCPVREDVPLEERKAEAMAWASRKIANNHERLSELADVAGLQGIGRQMNVALRRLGLARKWK
jgi:hypothetical protein